MADVTERSDPATTTTDTNASVENDKEDNNINASNNNNNNETKWPESIPNENESNIITIVAGNTNLRWSFHNGLAKELKPALFWRTPHLKGNDVKEDLSLSLARHLPQLVTDYLFGPECEHPTTEVANKAAENRPKVKVFIVSVVEQQSEYLASLWTSVPCNFYVMKEDDFYTKKDGRYDGMGIDRLAVLFGAQEQQGSPALVFDCGTAMTYTATDKNGKILGGGISPGLTSKLNSLRQSTDSLPPLSHGQVYERMKEALNKKAPISTFATNTKEAMITSILSEIACWSRRVISQWMNTVGRSDSNKNKSTSYDNAQRLVLLTGGDAEVLYQLLTKGAAGVLECKSSGNNKDPLMEEYAVTHTKHLIHYGIAAAIMKQHVIKLCNSQEYRDKIMEENQSLIDQRIAKQHKSKIIRGTIAKLTFSTTNRNEHDLLNIVVKYDTGEEEKVDMKELQTLLKLYKQHGEKDINAKSSSSTPNKRKSAEASTPKKKKEKKQPTPKKVPVTFNDPDELKGRRVAKYFEKDLFFGVIKGHEKDEGVIYWQIEYDDGDAEDFELKDLKTGFALYAANKHLDAEQSGTNAEATEKTEAATASTTTTEAEKMDVVEPEKEKDETATTSKEKETATTKEATENNNGSNNKSSEKKDIPQDSMEAENEHLLV